MATKTTYVIGTLLLVILISGIVYISLNDKVRLRVDEDKSTFYVKEEGSWVVSGREYNALFQGTTKKYRDVENIVIEKNIDEDKKSVVIKRKTPYKSGPTIIDTYEFNGNLDDVDLFPISHTVEVLNGQGYIYQCSYRRSSE